MMNVSRNITFDLGFTVCDYIQLACCFAYILQSPLYIFVICAGFQHCRKPHSRSSTTTHSDVITFNMAAVEMIGVTSSAIFVLNVHVNFDLEVVVQDLAYMVAVAQTLLHILVCLERYLAVAHPITYLQLKKKGTVIRNTSIAGVWLSSFIMVCMYPFVSRLVFVVLLLVTGLLSLVLVTFFCTGVLCVLIRPGPGERGGERRHIDQSKRRAFYTVAAIAVSLMLKFGLMFVLYMVAWTKVLPEPKACLILVASLWFNIPSSLVMPLLFLYRRVRHHRRTK